MKRFLHLLIATALFLSLFMTGNPVQAAAGLYTFSVVTGAYDDIDDDFGYTSVSYSDTDDGSAGVSLPFDFIYDGIVYNNLSININGLVGMIDLPTNSYINNLSGTYGKPLLAPLWDDLGLQSEGEIGYATLGDAPNRVFVVQWQNVHFLISDGSPQNFQVRLHETTHIIEFVYGTMSELDGSPTASIGIVDATGGSGHFLSVTPAAGTGDAVSSTTANNSIQSAVHLTSGKTYVFTPLDPSAPPSCTMNLGPADGATDVLLNAALNWTSGGGQVNGYKLYFGAENPPASIANGTDLGNATTFQLSANLDSNTTYYWQIVPHNTNGDAANCPVWSFTTGSVYTIDLLNESFTGTTFPPTDWSLSTNGACTWSRVTAGSNPTQAPYSTLAEAMFNSFNCSVDSDKQLITPALDLSAGVEYSLDFWMYHDTLYGSTFLDRVQVQVSLDGGSTFENAGAEIYRYTGANGWTNHTLDLSAYAGEPSVRVAFMGISGYGANIFLDDVRVLKRQPTARPNCAISPVPQDDAANVMLLANLSWANGGGDPIGYKLFFGTDNPPTNLVNGTNLGKTTGYNPAAIMAADAAHYWQVVPYNSFGDAQICPVWSFTSGPGGINDFPYVEGFESGAGGWASGGANSSWELGTPAGAVITAASTGANAWTTGLTTPYNQNERSYVQSPAFDFSSLEHPYLKFDLWWDAQEGQDGANLQASLDGGVTWDTIGEYGSGEGNWYQFKPTGLGFASGWTGDSITDDNSGDHYAGRGWRTAILDASDLSGEPFVLLRFYFGEGGADVQGDGFAFDNFEIRPGCAWTGAQTDAWHTGNNWDCGHAPGAEEIALIPFSTSRIPVISADTAVSAVRVGAGLILNGGSLTTRYLYEYRAVTIANGNEVNLVGSGNAWEATRETLTQWGSATNGLVRFSGPGLQRIVHDYNDSFPPGNSAQFYNLAIESGVQLRLDGNLQAVNNLTVNQGGTLDMGLSSLTVGNTLTNNGTLRQKRAANGTAGPIVFLNTGSYGGLTLESGGQNLGETSVQILGNQECFYGAVRRCFQITSNTAPASGVGLTFYFAQSEIPSGSSCSAMEAYRWNGTAWSSLARDTAYGTEGRDCTSEPFSIRVTGVTDFSEFIIADANLNKAPSIALENKITSLSKDTSTATAIRVADIVVTDDALGDNVLSLSGPDAELFEIVGTELRLKAGIALDFEVNPTLNVTVAVDDSTVGGNPDDTAELAISSRYNCFLPLVMRGGPLAQQVAPAD